MACGGTGLAFYVISYVARRGSRIGHKHCPTIMTNIYIYIYILAEIPGVARDSR
jgi:hypothetical protein